MNLTSGFAANYNGQEIALPLHVETPCVSYVKVQSHRSPFDGDWRYWSQRLSKFPGIARTEAILLKRWSFFLRSLKGCAMMKIMKARYISRVTVVCF